MGEHKSSMYKKVKAEVLKMIENNNLPPHTKLPSEAEISAQFNTSKMTSKLAYNSLEEDGIIYRLPRSGSFVADCQMQEPPIQKAELSGKFIALVLPQLDYYTSEILVKIEHELRKKGYQLVIKTSMQDERLESKLLDELVQQFAIKGIILFPVARRFCGDTLAQLQLQKYPIVLIDTIFKDLSLDSVYHNHYAGFFDMTSYFIQKGHTNIGMISYNVDNSSSRQDRVRGYMDALVHHKLFVDKHHMLHLGHTSDKRCYFKFFQNNPELTAVACLDDFVATHAMHVLLEMGKKIPQDISLSGFTDNRLLDFLPIMLTTVRQPTRQLAQDAIQLLFRRINKPDEPVSTIIIDTKIIERTSVKSISTPCLSN